MKFSPKHGRKCNRFGVTVASAASCKSEPWISWIGPAPTWMIRWCLCNNAAATVSWAGVNFDGFLGRMQISKEFAMIPWQRSGCTVAQACFHGSLCIFWRLVWHELNKNLEHQFMCRHVFYTGVFDFSLYLFVQTHLPQGVHVHSHMRTFFITVGGHRWRGSARLFRPLVWDRGPSFNIPHHYWCEILFLTWGTIEVLSIFFFIFGQGGECTWVFEGVYAHTHSMHVGSGPGVGIRHPRGPKNRDEINLGIYVFRKCIQSTLWCVYMCQ